MQTQYLIFKFYILLYSDDINNIIKCWNINKSNFFRIMILNVNENNPEKEELTQKTCTQLQKNQQRHTILVTPKTKIEKKRLLTKGFLFGMLLSNILLPGVGTVSACRRIKKEQLKKAFSALGVVSLITAPIIVGYLLSISSSIFFYKCYIKEISIDEYVTLIQNSYKNKKKK